MTSLHFHHPLFPSISLHFYNPFHHLSLVVGKSNLLTIYFSLILHLHFKINNLLICFSLILCMRFQINNFWFKQEEWINGRQWTTWRKHYPVPAFYWCYSVKQVLKMFYASKPKTASSWVGVLSCQTFIFGEYFPVVSEMIPSEDIVEMLCARLLVKGKKWCRAAHMSSPNCSCTSNWGILADGFIITLC